jgi:hypothetical protein
VYRGKHNEFDRFQKTIMQLAKKDGYHLSFTDISGSDHWKLDRDWNGTNWGLGGQIISDVTRASVLMGEGVSEPRQMSGCTPWRKILPAKSVANKGMPFCWPCHKFQALYPEFACGHEHSTGMCCFQHPRMTVLTLL